MYRIRGLGCVKVFVDSNVWRQMRYVQTEWIALF